MLQEIIPKTFVVLTKNYPKSYSFLTKIQQKMQIKIIASI